MFETIIRVIMLYLSDSLQLLLFTIGLAAIIEYFATRHLARLLVNIQPRQLAVFIYAQLTILLIALIGFKYIVLTGGPGIAVHDILRTGTFTKDFSIASIGLGTAVAVLGLLRLLRHLIRTVILVRL